MMSLSYIMYGLSHVHCARSSEVWSNMIMTETLEWE